MNSRKNHKKLKKDNHRKDKKRGDKPPKNKNIRDKILGTPFELSSTEAEKDLHKEVE